MSDRRSTGLVDVLDRVLDKGLVVAGDVRVALAEVELLTIRIRLLVCSIDKAREVGLDWWRNDPHFTPMAARMLGEDKQLRRQVAQLEQKVRELSSSNGGRPAPKRARRKRTSR